jgi:hypothetical protein
MNQVYKHGAVFDKIGVDKNAFLNGDYDASFGIAISRIRVWPNSGS